jgi:hypothetical protein
MRSYAAFNEEVVKRYEEWLVVQHYKPRTKQSYRRMVRTFAEYLRDKSIAGVTHLDGCLRCGTHRGQHKGNGLCSRCSGFILARLKRSYDRRERPN